MTAPAVAAARFAGAAWVGVGLGAVYGVLRPLRRKRNWPADLLFMGAVCYGWLYVGFGICGGDLRPVWLAAMLLGGIGWEMTLGRLLRPLYFRIFDILGKILHFIRIQTGFSGGYICKMEEMGYNSREYSLARPAEKRR